MKDMNEHDYATLDIGCHLKEAPPWRKINELDRWCHVVRENPSLTHADFADELSQRPDANFIWKWLKDGALLRNGKPDFDLQTETGLPSKKAKRARTPLSIREQPTASKRAKTEEHDEEQQPRQDEPAATSLSRRPTQKRLLVREIRNFPENANLNEMWTKLNTKKNRDKKKEKKKKLW
uniref:DUF1376 domain-containing protein n=1 Tax=Steinernema glaseri TaxID=37863 RepID=A0A1I7ZT00_9BILA